MQTLSVYSNLDVKIIKNAMKSTTYGRYILLYLYDGDRHDAFKQTQDLFSFYGREINNELGSDFTLFTVYEKEMLENWGVFVGTEKLKKQFVHEEPNPKAFEPNSKSFNLMITLANYYKVALPALLVIDTNTGVNASELVAKIEFNMKTPVEEIYNRIISAIKAIKAYYGDFNRIASACKTNISVEYTTLAKKLTGNMSLYNLLSDYINRSQYNQGTLSEALGVSDRQLRRYMVEDTPLKYEIAIAMAVLLKLTPDELDKMFDAAKVKPILEDNERYDIIRKCLRSQKDLEITNQILVKNGCRPIEKPCKSKK